MTSSRDRLARRIRNAERQGTQANTLPRLPSSSIDSGALTLKDFEGNVAGFVGRQFDGTVTATAVGGTWPSRPTMPYLEPTIGGLKMYWDGTYDDDSYTRMDFRRVTLHAVTDIEDLDILSPSQVVGEITTAAGGEAACWLPPVEHFVVAVVWTDAGKFSEASDPAFATPLKGTMYDEWQEHETALDTLNNATLPALQTDIAANQTAVATLNDTTLPALESDLAASEAATAAVQLIVDGWTTTGQTTIDGGQITADTVTALQIAARTITALQIAVGAITANEIAARTITAEEIAAAAITANELAVGSVTAQHLDVEVLRAGFTLTGRLQVGESYWTPAEGIVIPQPDGTATRFPADGVTAAQISGHVKAKSLTIEKDLNLNGSTNQIQGSIKLSIGITTPNSEPSVYQSWDTHYSSTVDNGGAGWAIYRGMCTAASSANFATIVNYLGAGIRIVNKSTGALAVYPDPTNGKAWTTDFYPQGGGGHANGHYFLYGQDAARSNGWYIYKIHDTTFDKVSELYVGAFGIHNTLSLRMTASTAAGGVYLVFCNAANEVRCLTWDTNLGFLSDVLLYTAASAVNIEAATVTAADFGSLRLLVGVREDGMVFGWTLSSMTRDTTVDFPMGNAGKLQGLHYDSTLGKLMSFDSSGRIVHYSSHKTPKAITATYTWYDGDAAGSTHESLPSPAKSYTLPARSLLNIETPPAPDSGVTDVGRVDKANRVGVYVGIAGGSRRRQSYLGLNGDGTSVRTLTLDAVNTTNPVEPVSNSFASASAAPGAIYSGLLDGGSQPVTQILGDGTAKFGSVATPVLSVGTMSIKNTGWTDLANTLAVGAVQYRERAGWACVRINTTASTFSGTTYTISSAALPAALRPSKNARGACDFSGYPGTIVVLPSGNIQVAHISGATRSTIEGFATWPIE